MRPIVGIVSTCLLSLIAIPASAQQSPPPGGGHDALEAPGAYASPSAIPQDPAAVDLGIPSARGLKRLDPIALPEPVPKIQGPDLKLPAIPAFAPQPQPHLDIARPPNALTLRATLGKDGPAIPSDLVWRLFAPAPGGDGKLPVIAVAKGGEAVFDVPPGAYLLHVGYGRAGMTKRIDFNGRETHETVAIDAGGLRLVAKASDTASLPKERVHFDIFSEATEERDRRLVASDVPPGVVVRLNSGNYHVVSRYGDVNAVARAEVRVESGRITDAVMKQRGAQLTMKLVREHGGEALADTAWSITSTQGDLIQESVGAFPSMVLAEGDYVIVARNKERIFQRQFRVVSGEDADVEVLTSDLVDPNSPDVGTGD
ncbi:hypothetical protein [Aureimonas sp. AU20]|uniref:hypothetical protein n=1 Tax=Aureimonas sp. AU20 TaxID=1349819 RepID=UPI000B29A3F1|nr:hypothetical protein [Aureimonas sp. AU20]